MIQFTHQPSGNRFSAQQATIDEHVPTGQFAAVDGSTIVAQAESHRELVQLLQHQGRSPKDLVVLQSGTEYPSSAVIF